MHEGEHARNEERHKAGEIDYENLKTAKPSLDKQYVYFQEMKAFIRDFIDCYNEKVSSPSHKDYKRVEIKINVVLI